MADSGYLLWLEKLAASQQEQWISIQAYSFQSAGGMNRRTAGARTTIDTIQLAAAASNCTITELAMAGNRGTNLGRGRLDAVLPSGDKRLLLAFESTLVGAFVWKGVTGPGSSEFLLDLYIDKLRVTARQMPGR